VDEHWIYLQLPTPLEEGTNYDLRIVNDLFPDGLTYNFNYEVSANVSSLLHVNNIAYSTAAAEKYAYLYSWIGDGGALNLDELIGNQFSIVDNATGIKVFNGEVAFRKGPTQLETYQGEETGTSSQNFNGTFVYECDFSDFNEPGSYHILVENVGRSFDFEISCNAFRLPFEKVMKGIYNNRSGYRLEQPYSESTRPKPHHPSETPGFSGKLKFTSTTLCDVSDADASFADKELWEGGYLGDLTESWGWYQDAGDWDGYVSHHKVSSLLMLAYEHYPSNFTDGQLFISESSNGLPDILDEARWLIRFYKRLKDETEANDWTSGGVPGSRIFGDLWGDDFAASDQVRGSWQDVDRDWYVSGEETNVTFLYSAMAAQFAYLLEREGLTDPENIDWEQEAISTYLWANDRHSASDICQDYQVDWSKNYASAALFRLTANATYETDFVDAWNAIGTKDNLQGEDAFGAYIYNFTTLERNATVLAESNALIKSTANYNLREIGDDRACRWGGNPFFPMLSGQPTTPYVVEGIVAAKLLESEGDPLADDYLRIIHNTADYFMGNNPLRMTWITGLGEISPTGILHLDSWATGDGSSKEGIVPYGPWRKQGGETMAPTSNEWPHQWTYPNIDSWPGHERWFSQRYSPISCEFTIHQNNATAAFVYGALSGNYNCSEIVDTKDLELNNESKITIYPNPSPGKFRIKGEFESFKLEVINNIGQTLLILPELANNYEIDLGNLSDGVYYLKITADNGTLSLKQILKVN